jgi:hypothetical protein
MSRSTAQLTQILRLHNPVGPRTPLLPWQLIKKNKKDYEIIFERSNKEKLKGRYEIMQACYAWIHR